MYLACIFFCGGVGAGVASQSLITAFRVKALPSSLALDRSIINRAPNHQQLEIVPQQVFSSVDLSMDVQHTYKVLMVKQPETIVCTNKHPIFLNLPLPQNVPSLPEARYQVQ